MRSSLWKIDTGSEMNRSMFSAMFYIGWWTYMKGVRYVYET
jgi:hypothetical protein